MALTATEEALIRQLLDQQAAILSLASSESTIISKLGATKVTLADLTAASSIGDSDLMLIRQGSTEKSVSGSIIKSIASQPDASETIKGIIEIATAAEAQALSSNVVAITPARLSSAFGGSNQSLSGSGYQKLPSGLIIQWGSAAIAATGSYVSLPIAFPNAFTAVMSSMYALAAPGVTANNNVGVQAQPDNLTRFTARCYQDGAGVAKSVTWMAIGY